jgi:polyisoprenoid-binding protein YceI
MNRVGWFGLLAVLLGIILSISHLHASDLVRTSEIAATIAPPVVQFKVKVMGILALSGRFHDVSGHIVDVGTQGEFAANIAVNAESVRTTDPARDRFLRSAAFFDVDRYPVIRFEGVQLIRDELGAPHLIGDLTLHGQTRRVAFTLARTIADTCGPVGGPACYVAYTTISRSAFGLHGFRLIASDEVEITVHLGRDAVALMSAYDAPSQGRSAESPHSEQISDGTM